MKNLLLLICISVIASGLQAQSPDSAGFISARQRIDSIVTSIDTNKQMTHILSAGHLMWGEFKANCYYMVGSNTISKMECFFNDSTAGKKVFYYDANVPVQIIDKGTTYYYTGSSLLHADGRKVKPYMANDMVFFSKEVNKMMLSLIE